MYVLVNSTVRKCQLTTLHQINTLGVSTTPREENRVLKLKDLRKQKGAFPSSLSLFPFQGYLFLTLLMASTQTEGWLGVADVQSRRI
jgi:hypothetical protein